MTCSWEPTVRTSSTVWVGRAYDRGIEVGDGLLRGVRLGQNTLRTTRVVIDLDRYDRHRLLFLSHPERIVIDVYGDRKAPPPVSAGGRQTDAALPAPLREVHRVVVDAGRSFLTGRPPGRCCNPRRDR